MSARKCGLDLGSLLPQRVLRQVWFDHKRSKPKEVSEITSSCGCYLCLTDNMQERVGYDTSLSLKGFIFSLAFTVVFIIPSTKFHAL